MKIGFIKFGLKTYFNKDGTGQGSNHELVDLFHIFKEHGHECCMISAADIEYSNKTKVDYYFVLNGPMCDKPHKPGLNMFDKYFWPYQELLISDNTPWIYFQTDPRKEYNVENNELFDKNKSKLIFTQEKKYYGHLDKLILYKKQILQTTKKIEMAIIMNQTNDKRHREGISVCDWFNKQNVVIYGKHKKNSKYLAEQIPERNLSEFLTQLKYSWNMAVDPNWVSQKYWEMILHDVICFYQEYDNSGLLLSLDDERRVVDPIDVDNKINYLNNNITEYQLWLERQRAEMLPEYLDGEFIYSFIYSKLQAL